MNPAEIQSSGMGELLLQHAQVSPEAIEAALDPQPAGDPRRLGESLIEGGGVLPNAVLDTLKSQAEVGSQCSRSSIPVDVNLLDTLMNLVGELVLACHQILQFTAAHNGSNLLGTARRLNPITSERSEGVMKTPCGRSEMYVTSSSRGARSGRAVGQAGIGVEIHRWQPMSAQPINRDAVDQLNTTLFLRTFESHQFQRVHLRDRKPFSTAGRNQGRSDRQPSGILIFSVVA